MTSSTAPETPAVSSTLAFLRQVRRIAPQGMTLVSVMSLAAAAPSAVRAADIHAMHGRYPLTVALPHDVLARIVDPDGRYARARDLCVGPVRPSGYRAESLLYDRRLGILVWLDRNGHPTAAPAHYQEAPITIVGPVVDRAPDQIVYAFSERQDRDAIQRTIEQANRQLTDSAIAVAPAAASPFDGCAFPDAQRYPTLDPGVPVCQPGSPAGPSARRASTDPVTVEAGRVEQAVTGTIHRVLDARRASGEYRVESAARQATNRVLDQAAAAVGHILRP